MKLLRLLLLLLTRMWTLNLTLLMLYLLMLLLVLLMLMMLQLLLTRDLSSRFAYQKLLYSDDGFESGLFCVFSFSFVAFNHVFKFVVLFTLLRRFDL